MQAIEIMEEIERDILKCKEAKDEVKNRLRLVEENKMKGEKEVAHCLVHTKKDKNYLYVNSYFSLFSVFKS